MFWPFNKRETKIRPSGIRLYRIWHQGHRETHILATSPEVPADYINRYYRHERWYGTGSIEERLARRTQLIRARGEHGQYASKWEDLGEVLASEVPTLQRLHLTGEVHHQGSLNICTKKPVYFEIHEEDRDDPGIVYTIEVYDEKRDELGYLSESVVVRPEYREAFYSKDSANRHAKTAGLKPLPES